MIYENICLTKRYEVLNLTTGECFKGDVQNAKEAYAKIKICPGDTTILWYGRQTITREWRA